MLHKNPYIEGGGGLGALVDVYPKDSEPKETWGDKGREGIPKNEKMGRRLLWIDIKHI